MARTAVRERFLREARAAAALRHPNVAGVFRFGALASGDRCYCAMELVEGETLEALVRRDGPLKLETALEIAIQVRPRSDGSGRARFGPSRPETR